MKTSEPLLVEELHALTMTLIQRLDDTSYEDMASFVKERERIVNQLLELSRECDDTSKSLIMEIQTYDNQILNRMEYFKREASDWLTRQGQIKSQQAAYNQGFTSDSFFIDNKK